MYVSFATADDGTVAQHQAPQDVPVNGQAGLGERRAQLGGGDVVAFVGVMLPEHCAPVANSLPQPVQVGVIRAYDGKETYEMNSSKPSLPDLSSSSRATMERHESREKPSNWNSEAKQLAVLAIEIFID